MIAVIDTNVLANHLLRWDHKFYAIYDKYTWIAPIFLKSELAQVLWKQRSLYKVDELKEIWTNGVNLLDEFVDEAVYAHLALELAVKHDHAYYDAAFLALAQMHNCGLMSYDKKMLDIAITLDIGRI